MSLTKLRRYIENKQEYGDDGEHRYGTDALNCIADILEEQQEKIQDLERQEGDDASEDEVPIIERLQEMTPGDGLAKNFCCYLHRRGPRWRLRIPDKVYLRSL